MADGEPGAAVPAEPPRAGTGTAAVDLSAGETRWPPVVWAAPVALLAALLGLIVLFWWQDHRDMYAHARAALVAAMGPAGRDAPLTIEPDVHLGLVLEVATALLLAAGLHVLLRRREAERRLAGDRMRVLEALNRVAADLAGNRQPAAGAGEACSPAHRDRLRALSEAARQLMDMDRAGVSLYDQAAGRLEVLASAGDMPPGGGPRFYDVAGLPGCRAVLDSGEPLLAGDAMAAGRPLNREVLARYRAAALVLIPLQVEQERIGLLTLSSSRPRPLGEPDRQLARVLGAHASLILAHARLYTGMAAALDAQRHLAEQRDALWAVSTAAFGAATLTEALQSIVRLAPEALEVHSCSVALTTANPDEMVLAATTGRPAEELVAGPFSVAGRHGGEVLRTGRPVVVEDGRADPRVSKWGRDGMPIGSVVYLPLVRRAAEPGAKTATAAAEPPPPAAAAVFGIMGLVRERTGPVDPEQLRLAEVFADRAAAAIEHARLREQTDDLLARTRQLLEQARRDRDTRTLLLRELHHRVKNNLAGIAGLLAVRPPGLADGGSPVGRWVDRIADRVHTMAHAHDLFVGGTGSARLGDVVRRVVDALPINGEGKPVTVLTELGDAVHVPLLSEQVVGLSMAIHELCFNALAHGLPGGGTLAVSAGLAGSTLVLEVADDGRGLQASGEEDLFGPVPARDPTAGSGLGLTLVDGLVRRELRGTFELVPRSPRGTVARVTLPLSAGDQRARGAEAVTPSAAAVDEGVS